MWIAIGGGGRRARESEHQGGRRGKGREATPNPGPARIHAASAG